MSDQTNQSSKFSSKVKRINVELPNYQYFHSPSLIDQNDKRFIGRDGIIDRLKNILTQNKFCKQCTGANYAQDASLSFYSSPLPCIFQYITLSILFYNSERSEYFSFLSSLNQYMLLLLFFTDQ